MNIPQGFNIDVLKAFGLEKSPGTWDEFFDRAAEAVMITVIRRLERELPEEKMEEFFRVFEGSATDAEKKVFLDANVPHFTNMLGEEVARFKKEALAHTKRP